MGFGRMGAPSQRSLSTGEDSTKQGKLLELIEEYRKSGRKVFDEALQFPTSFTLRIVGVREPTFVSDMLQLVAQSTGTPAASISHQIRPSSGDKYVSISVTPFFKSSSELYATYDALGRDSRVKVVL